MLAQLAGRDSYWLDLGWILSQVVLKSTVGQPDLVVTAVLVYLASGIVSNSAPPPWCCTTSMLLRISFVWIT